MVPGNRYGGCESDGENSRTQSLTESMSLTIQKQERDHWIASWELETMLAKTVTIFIRES